MKSRLYNKTNEDNPTRVDKQKLQDEQKIG